MEYIKEFKDLLDNPQWENEFVGYGNPNAKILIIGKEAAAEQGSIDWEKFYAHNHEQWKDTIKTLHGNIGMVKTNISFLNFSTHNILFINSPSNVMGKIGHRQPGIGTSA